MFSPTPSTRSASQAADYYEPLDEDDEIWVGKGRAQLGIEPAGRELFIKLAEGKLPDGTRVIQHNKGKHRTGIDLTFAAPKWAGVVMVGATEAERELIQQAWNETILVAWERLEARAETVVKTKVKAKHRSKSGNEKTERVPGDLLGFVAHHHTARPTKETEERGDPPDPHLHSHIFVFNMAWSRTENKWKAVHEKAFDIHRKRVEYEVHGEFLRRMNDLGYKPETRQNHRGEWVSEIAALAKACLFWSSNKRREAVLSQEYEAKHKKPPSKAYLRKLMQWRRLEKDREQIADWEGWQHAAKREYLNTEEERKNLYGEDPEKFPYFDIRVDPEPFEIDSLEDRREILFERLYAPEGLCHQDSSFNRHSLETSLARCAVGLGFTLSEIDDLTHELIEEHLITVDADHKNQMWTTKVNLHHEKQIKKMLAKKNDTIYPAPSVMAIQRAFMSLKEKGTELDKEQIAMVQAHCSHNGAVFSEGVAGSGKTKATTATVLAFRDTESTGKSVANLIVTISTARLTANETGRKLDADNYHSIESFVYATQTGSIKPDKQTVIIVDESAMVDNPRMYELLKASRDAQVIFIGDPKQMQPIGAGGWYKDAVRKYGATMLTKVWRQKNLSDIEALFALRTGKSKIAVDSFNSRDRIQILDTHEDRVGKIVQDYFSDRDKGISAKDVRIVVDGANTEIDTINRIIQLDRIEREEIAGDLPFAMHGIKSDRAVTIYAGDQISFISTYYDEQTRVHIPNGMSADVLGVDPYTRLVHLHLIEEDRDVVCRLPLEQPELMVSPNYAIHAQRLQGGEASIIRCMPGMRTTSLQGGYSQTSRCIDEVHIYIDHVTHGEDAIAGLTGAWKKSKEKISALSRMGRNKIWDRDHKDPEPKFHPSEPAPSRPPPKPRARSRDDDWGLSLHL